MDEDYRMFAYNLFTLPVNQPELPILAKHLEGHWSIHHDRQAPARPSEAALDGKSFPALLAPSAKDQPSGPGAHPFAEAVIPSSLDISRLECPLHYSFLVLVWNTAEVRRL